MKKFLREFKAFAMRGNVIDLAVGVVIGGAFSSITTSLVNDIINPVLGLFTGDNSALAALAIHLPGGGDIMVGNFINAVVNFVIMAFVVFCMVKAINRLYRKKEEAPAAPTTKVCPFCKSEISIEATRCPHCTSLLEEEEKKSA